MDLLTEAARLERIAEDLRAIHANGGEPPPGRLETAPILTEWRPVTVPALAYAGVVVGHPRLGDDRVIRTSQVWTSGKGWIRTLSRFYFLSGRGAD